MLKSRGLIVTLACLSTFSALLLPVHANTKEDHTEVAGALQESLEGLLPIEVEYGSEKTAKDLLDFTANIIQDIDTMQLGYQSITYLSPCSSLLLSVPVFVIDSKAPIIESENESYEYIVGQEFDASDLNLEVYDPVSGELDYSQSEKENSWWIEEEPDLNEEGDASFTIEAMDASGNITIEEFDVTVSVPVVYNDAAPSLAYEKEYSHTIDTSAITSQGYDYMYAYTPIFLNYIRNGQNRLYYSGDAAAADLALGEVVYCYCALSSGGNYYDGQDENGTYFELTPSALSQLQSAVAAADANASRYPSEIYAILSSLDLNVSDYELVNEINAYLTNNYTYVLTNNGQVESLLSSGVGQCYHFAHVFADLCNSCGISATYIANGEHAYDTVCVEGVTYTFDPTFNNTSHSTAYSWIQN
jgi:transglutaminase-like putative cysteine protease